MRKLAPVRVSVNCELGGDKMAYQISKLRRFIAIPWEMVVPVAALGFIGLIMYFISR
jgi:hypothetical protein